jgi:hypothetical protein
MSADFDRSEGPNTHYSPALSPSLAGIGAILLIVLLNDLLVVTDEGTDADDRMRYTELLANEVDSHFLIDETRVLVTIVLWLKLRQVFLIELGFAIERLMDWGSMKDSLWDVSV